MLKYIIIILLCLVCVSAHDGGDDDSSLVIHREYTNGISAVMPWTYFANGQWTVAVLMLGIWIVLFRGIYILFLLVMHKAIIK